MSTRTIAVAVAVLAVAVLAGAARADWVPGMPAKYVQPPDLSSMGLDVNATWYGPYPYVKVLADDFPCESRGPITDIHIWGSWLDDRVNPNTTFKLSIHDDIPAGQDPGIPYSHPGELRWQEFFGPSEYLRRPWATANEMFFEPNTNQIIGMDNTVFQYNFYIPAAEAFVQEGMPGARKVYWLAVQAIVPAGGAVQEVFGWKTSPIHWNDGAVFEDVDYWAIPRPEDWRKLIDPRTEQSLDMAFVITPEPATLALLGLGAAGLAARRRSKK